MNNLPEKETPGVDAQGVDKTITVTGCENVSTAGKGQDGLGSIIKYPRPEASVSALDSDPRILTPEILSAGHVKSARVGAKIVLRREWLDAFFGASIMERVDRRKDFKGFVRLNRGEELNNLIRDPKAFALLTLIALRARYANSGRLDGLKIGQALIGDWEASGLKTRSEYRAALKRLIKKGYVTAVGKHSLKEGKCGTIATITNDSIYSITGPIQPSNDHQNNHHSTVTEYSNTTVDATTQTTAEQPPHDHGTTTNNKVIKEKGRERGTPSSITFSESDYRAIASRLKITESDAALAVEEFQKYKRAYPDDPQDCDAAIQWLTSTTAGKPVINGIRGSSNGSRTKDLIPEPQFDWLKLAEEIYPEYKFFDDTSEDYNPNPKWSDFEPAVQKVFIQRYQELSTTPS